MTAPISTTERTEATDTLYLASVPYAHPAVRNRIRRWDDQEQVHQAVMSLFRPDLPGAPGERRAASGILYRLEGEHRRLLVQSAIAPQRTDHGIRLTTLEGLLDQIDAGRRVRFSADLNAVRCQARTGRRLPVPAGELSQWTIDRLTPSLRHVELLDARLVTRSAGPVPIVVARVTGIGVVGQPDGLIRLLRSGVGRAKAYGCGLLSVLPAAS